MLGEVINWWTVVLLVWFDRFFRKRRAQQRCENDNILKSTFALIGRRALQMCICHKHNKTHNGNAFYNRNLVCFYFHSSFGFRNMSVLPEPEIEPVPSQSTSSCSFSFDMSANSAVFPAGCFVYSCELISWWSVIESAIDAHHTPSLHRLSVRIHTASTHHIFPIK